MKRYLPGISLIVIGSTLGGVLPEPFWIVGALLSFIGGMCLGATVVRP